MLQFIFFIQFHKVLAVLHEVILHAAFAQEVARGEGEVLLPLDGDKRDSFLVLLV